MPAVLVTGHTNTQNSPFLPKRRPKPPSPVLIPPPHEGTASIRNNYLHTWLHDDFMDVDFNGEVAAATSPTRCAVLMIGCFVKQEQWERWRAKRKIGV